MPCFFREDIHGSLPQVILVMMCSLCLLLSCSLSLPDVSEWYLLDTEDEWVDQLVSMRGLCWTGLFYQSIPFVIA